MVKSVGDRKHPTQSPIAVWNHSPIVPVQYCTARPVSFHSMPWFTLSNYYLIEVEEDVDSFILWCVYFTPGTRSLSMSSLMCRPKRTSTLTFCLCVTVEWRLTLYLLCT